VQTFDVAAATTLESTQALAYLWARKRIAELADFGSLRPKDEQVREVTSLGLSYNLLTAYTSFVAVDEVVRNPHGAPMAVRQPLPLPHGVEDSAVGGSGAPVSTTPEPSAILLLLVSMAVLACSRLRRVVCA
jgi:Ca-activated chloride channel family protein